MDTISDKNVNKLLIIGNGFDLSLKMQTTFKDFINSCVGSGITDLRGKLEDKMYSFNNNGRIQPTLIPRIFFELIYDEFNITLAFGIKDEAYNPLKDVFGNVGTLKYNFWIVYSLLKSNSKWVDIENDISEFVFDKSHTQRSSVYSLAKTMIFYGSRSNFDEALFNRKLRNSSPKEFMNKLIFNSELISILISCNSKFSELMKNVLTSDEISESELVDKLLLFSKNELHLFEKEFNSYMFDMISNSDSYEKASSNLLEKISSGDPYDLFNFNYTSPSSEHMNISNNIHGKLVKPDNFDTGRNNIIIGIDGEGIPMTSMAYQFTKTFRIALQENENHTSNIINSDLNNIIFFGHSLGEADFSYFKTIFDSCDLIGSNVSLTFCYSAHGSMTDRKLETDQMIKISKLLDLYAKRSNKISSGDDLLHLLVLNDRLNIKKLKFNKIRVCSIK